VKALNRYILKIENEGDVTSRQTTPGLTGEMWKQLAVIGKVERVMIARVEKNV
jgi:hypothetical protein